MNTRKPISSRVRFEIFKRDNFRCQYCGRTSKEAVLEVDHITPWTIGNPDNDNEENLITSCRECNRGKYTTAVISKEELSQKIRDFIVLHEKKALLFVDENLCYERLTTEKLYVSKIVAIDKGGIKREYTPMSCKTCGHHWEYIGNSRDKVICPECNTSNDITKIHSFDVHYVKTSEYIVGLD